MKEMIASHFFVGGHPLKESLQPDPPPLDEVRIKMVDSGHLLPHDGHLISERETERENDTQG